MRDCGALVPFADGETMTISSPFHIDGVDKIPPRRAPALGQHNAELLAEAGYSATDIEQLRGLGVVA